MSKVWNVGTRKGYKPNHIVEYGDTELDDTFIAAIYGLPIHCRLDDIYDSPEYETALYNARLIAAAPELLKALEGILTVPLFSEDFLEIMSERISFAQSIIYEVKREIPESAVERFERELRKAKEEESHDEN